ncbi:MAG TPA: LuxR C-terminal-related transcriptional regulator, partial [Chloroflexota bacterium]
FADHDDGERGLRLATALGYFWEARGCMVEGRRELEAALARASAADPSLRARALTWLGALLIWTLGDEEGANGTAAAEHATAVVNQALELARTVEDTVSIAQSLSHLGVLSLHTRNWDQGRRCLDEAQHYWQEAQHAWGIAHTLLYLGALELMQGHHEDAVRFAEESLVRSRDLGDDLARGLALVLLMLATGARADVSRAITLVRELLALSHETQNRRLMVLCAGGVAWLLGHQSEPKRLTRLLGAARAMRQATGFVGSQPLRGYVAIAGETLQARLGAEAFEAGLREGHALSFEQMTALIGQALDGALGDGAPTEAAPEPIKRNILSPREQEVLHLVAQGLSNKRIAQEIIVAESTVRYHSTSIFNKLGVDSRAHAIAVAAHRGLVLL